MRRPDNHESGNVARPCFAVSAFAALLTQRLASRRSGGFRVIAIQPSISCLSTATPGCSLVPQAMPLVEAMEWLYKSAPFAVLAHKPISTRSSFMARLRSAALNTTGMKSLNCRPGFPLKLRIERSSSNSSNACGDSATRQDIRACVLASWVCGSKSKEPHCGNFSMRKAIRTGRRSLSRARVTSDVTYQSFLS